MSVFSASRRADREPGARPAQPAQLSVLARGLKVTGEIESDGTITIEGRLEGVIRGSSQVVVAPGGGVVGDVSGREVVVSGRVEGDIAAVERIELKPGGVVQGDVSAPRIVVHEGGEVNGRFKMQRAAAAAPARAAADQVRLSA